MPQVLARRLRLAGDFDFQLIAQRTPGFVGADLQALTKEAAAVAIKRIFSRLGALPPPGAAVEDLMDAGAVGYPWPHVALSRPTSCIPSQPDSSASADGLLTCRTMLWTAEVAPLSGFKGSL